MGDCESTEKDRSSTLPKVNIALRGFPSENEARRAGDAIGAALWVLGTVINLERLDGVTVAYDYDAALAGLDRGFSDPQGLDATRDEFAVGVAMTPAVVRDGQIRAHMFLHGSTSEWLLDENHSHHKTAVYLLAHEAAHVEDLYFRDRAMPGVLLNGRLTQEEGVLFEIADACWSEYAACRRSAFAGPEQGKYLEDTLCDVLEGARGRGNNYIRKYRHHGDTTLLLSQLTDEYGRLVKYASYLLGHVTGCEETLETPAPRAHALIERTEYFRPLWRQLRDVLDEMWQTRESWAGLGAYDPLRDIVRELLRVAGVELSTRKEGLYIDVPYSAETMPEEGRDLGR